MIKYAHYLWHIIKVGEDKVAVIYNITKNNLPPKVNNNRKIRSCHDTTKRNLPTNVHNEREMRSCHDTPKRNLLSKNRDKITLLSHYYVIKMTHLLLDNYYFI